MPPKWWDLTMSRVIAVVACGFTLAACSTPMPSMNLSFLKSSPATEALRIESEPPGADAKTSQGQSCRTPCEVTVQTSGELSVTLALNGYQPQTVTVQQEPSDSSRLSPNPVYVELQPALMTPPAKKPAAKKKPKPATAAARPEPTPAPSATAAAPTALPTPVTEPAASATNFPWPSR